MLHKIIILKQVFKSGESRAKWWLWLKSVFISFTVKTKKSKLQKTGFCFSRKTKKKVEWNVLRSEAGWTEANFTTITTLTKARKAPQHTHTPRTTKNANKINLNTNYFQFTSPHLTAGQLKSKRNTVGDILTFTKQHQHISSHLDTHTKKSYLDEVRRWSIIIVKKNIVLTAHRKLSNVCSDFIFKFRFQILGTLASSDVTVCDNIVTILV